MSAELLKHGPFHMQHCLAKLFTSMLKGTYPTSLSTGLVTAVYKGKRRDPLNMNSYRPITVVPVLAKLFATVMEQRMTRWAEALNLTTAGWLPQGPQHSWTAEHTEHSGKKI